MTGLLQKVFARDEKAIERVAELRKSLVGHVKAKDEHDLSIWASVMDTIDKHASFAFQDVKDHIGDMTPRYVELLSSYRQKVVHSLKDAWGLTENEDFEENEILVHLDRVVARVMLHLSPEQGKKHAPEPLLCGMLMDHAWTTFGSIKEGLQEVSASCHCDIEGQNSPGLGNVGVSLVRDVARLLQDAASEEAHHERLDDGDVEKHLEGPAFLKQRVRVQREGECTRARGSTY